MNNKNENNPLGVLGGIVVAGLLIWAAFTGFGNSTSSPTPNTSTSTLTALYTNTTANVRTCASSNCKVVGTYASNTSVPVPLGVTDFSQLPEWVSFSYTANDGTSATGYINKSVLSDTQTTEVTATIETPTSGQGSGSVSNQTVASTPPVKQQAAPSASDIVTALSPRLAYITCDWYNRYGNVLFSKTSNGLLGPKSSSGTYFVSTVLGGVTDTAYAGYEIAPSTCSISFPAGASLYAGGFSSFTVGSYTAGASGSSPVNVANTSVDYAQVAIVNANNYLVYYAAKSNYCSTRPSVGDSIAVIGWPTGGAGRTLTGAITGTSGYYDTTNVSIPDGMQGSTAVSLSSGCIIGQINASGQIADFSQLAYLYGW